MGWLREMREQMGFRSDRRLAEHLLQRGDRPTDLKLENLANNLGKLDKGDTGWWLGVGEPWTPLLADALNLEIDELRTRIHQSAHPQGDEATSPDRYVPFTWLNALDLATEPLPPGIPWPLDLLGGGTDRFWWTAGPGAGKTLLGRWLPYQEGWTYLPARNWREALGRLPRSGRVYIELEQPGEDPVLASELPDGVVVWVSAPFAPTPTVPPMAGGDRQQEDESDEGEHDAPSWTEVRTPPLRDWIDALLAWVAPRVKPGGRYDTQEVIALLSALPLGEMFETPGDVLDFLGLVDEVGAAALQEGADLSTEALVRTWFRQATERSDRALSPSLSTLLRRDGARLLVELVQERLRAGRPSALSLEDWASLVPRRRAPPIDRDHLIALIEQGTPEAKAEAKAMLRPSKEDVIEAFRGVQILVRGPNGRWSLRPNWLANLAQAVAVEALAEEGPDGIGALLLYPQSAAAGLSVLIEQAARGELALVRACISDVDGQSPERLAALDGAFRVLGHRLLLGDEPPRALLTEAWQAQMAYVAERYLRFPPIPIIRVARVEPATLTHEDAWIRAALAISLHLRDAGVSLDLQPLNPWGGLPTEEPAREAYRQALSKALGDTFADRQDDAQGLEFARACARLGVEMYDRLGSLSDVHMVMRAAAPTLLVRLARQGAEEIPSGAIQEALELPRGLGPIKDACVREGVELKVVVGWLWRWWSVHPRQHPPFHWTSRDLNVPELLEQAKYLWEMLPVEAISGHLLHEVTFRPSVWPWLPATFWPVWVRAQLSSPHAWHREKLWDHVPTELLVETMRSASLPAHQLAAYSASWRRVPEAMLALVDGLVIQSERVIPHGTNIVLELMHTGLSHRPEELLDRAERWWRDLDAFPGAGPRLELWLMRAIEERVPGWRRAFGLLTQGR